MADEPRRSGRATKGQHTKNQDEAEPQNTPTSKSTKTTKGKGSKKTPAALEDEGEGGSDIIRCICGIQEDEGERKMICCDNCEAWQHNDCMGITEVDDEMPDSYLCEQCGPQEHPDLFAALANGMKPEEEAARRRSGKPVKAKKGGRKSKGGRASTGGAAASPSTPETSAPSIDAQPGQTEGNKRRRSMTDSKDEQPSKLRKSSQSDAKAVDASVSRQQAESTSAGRKAAKPAPTATATATATDEYKLADSVASMSNGQRRKPAELLRTTLVKAVSDAISKGKYSLSDDASAESLSDRFAVIIEYSLFMHYAPVNSPQYRDQYNAIRNNLPKNDVLLVDILSGKTTPDALATMKASDMLSAEQKQKNADMQAENEKQASLTTESAPRYRKTHKGDELIEDPNADYEHAPERSAPARAVETKQEETKPDLSQTRGNPGQQPTNPSESLHKIDTSGQDSQADGHGRRASSNFNIQNVWSSVQSPVGGSHPPPQGSPVRVDSATQPPQPAGQRHDADVDRLLADEDGAAAYSAPLDPTELGSNTIWTGTVEIPAMDISLQGITLYVAGSQFHQRVPAREYYPDRLTLQGRIQDSRADEYVLSLSATRNPMDVTVHGIFPSTNDPQSAAQFEALWKYLADRQRWGVIGEDLHRGNVRDIYIIPLEAGGSNYPNFLRCLKDNLLQGPFDKRMLLTVFVMRYKAGEMSPGIGIPSPKPANSPLPPLFSSSSGGNQNGTPDTHMHQPAPYNSNSNSNQPTVGSGSFQPGQFPTNPYDATPPTTYPQHPRPAAAANQQQYPQHAPSQRAAAGTELTSSAGSETNRTISKEEALAILGHWQNSKVSQMIVSSQTESLTVHQVQSMRNIMDKNSLAADDFVAFQQMLSQGAGQ